MAAANISGIYEIVNTTNGNKYIGSSVNIRRRWAQHVARLRAGEHHSPPLQRAWRKYGQDAFKFSVLIECPREDLVTVEQEFLDKFLPAYNVAKAAGYRTFLGLKHRPETIEKMSDAHRGNTRTKGMRRSREAVEATASAHRGMKRTAETKARIAAKKVGIKLPPRTEEHRAKLSAAHKGKPKSPEQMAALQEGRRRREYTEAQRAQIGAKSKAAWDRRKAEQEAARR